MKFHPKKMTKTIIFEDINVLYVIRFNINYDLYKKN